MSINPAEKHILTLTIKKLDGCQIQTCRILLYDRKLICLKILNQCWNTIQLCYSSLAGPLNSVCFCVDRKSKMASNSFHKVYQSSLGCFLMFKWLNMNDRKFRWKRNKNRSEKFRRTKQKFL